jgi:cell division septum initiation protein DivIVA
MAARSKVPNEPLTAEMRRFLDDLARKIDQLLAAVEALDARVTALEP